MASKRKRKIFVEKYRNPAHARKVLIEKILPKTTCLYFHVNIEKQEPFYVGIGTDERPYSKDGRNIFWNKTTVKYGYIVVVLYVNLTWEQACEKEVYWIARIGRRDLKEGTLVNLTDGGDGVIGRKCSEETKEKISKSSMGKKMSEKAKIKMSKSKTGTVSTQIRDLSGQVFGKLTAISKTENRYGKTFWLCNCDCGTKDVGVSMQSLTYGITVSCGCISIVNKGLNNGASKPILQIDKLTGEILSAFESIIDATRLTGCSAGSIGDYINKKGVHGSGYNWKVINKNEYKLYEDFRNISTNKYMSIKNYKSAIKAI